MFKRRYRVLISNIAMAAVLFAALAPAISHALIAKHAPLTLWQELCTAQGIKRVAAVDSAHDVSASLSKQALAATDSLNADNAKTGMPAPEKMAMHFEHCPYCFSHVAAVTLPPSMMQTFLAQLNAPVLTRQYDAPSLAVYYPSTHATRAPPPI